MARPSQPIVVEEVDFTKLFQFPRVLRAVTMAMQPPRLAVGLLMIALLFVGGRTWDGITTPSVNPDGLTAGAMSADQITEQQRVLRSAIMDYVRQERWPQPQDSPDAWPRQDVADVVAQIERGYRHERRTIASGADGEGGSGPRAVRQADDAYLRTLAQIESFRPRGTFEATSRHVARSIGTVAQGVVFVQPASVVGGLYELFVRMPVALWRNHRGFLFIFGVYFLFVLAVCGGALSRMAVMEVSGRENMRIREAVDFSLGNWLKLMVAPAMPLILAAALCGVIMLMGLFTTLPWLDVIGTLFYGLALIFGLLIAVLVLVYTASFHLLIPAIATENCDVWDAQQRAYAYVLNRPLHWLGYGLVGIVGMALGFVVVSVVAVVTLNVTAGLFSTLTTNSALTAAGGFAMFDLTPQPATAVHDAWHSRVGAWLVQFWQSLVVSVVAAYVLAYYFAASTIVYLLMRRTCDGQDMAEVWRPGLVPGTLVPIPVGSVAAMHAPHADDAARDGADSSGRDENDDDRPGSAQQSTTDDGDVDDPVEGDDDDGTDDDEHEDEEDRSRH